MDNSEKLIEAIEAASEEVEGRLMLSCRSAFKVAEQFNVELKSIGKICNQKNIKMRHCQLGCF